jgi:predicted nucleic acid-binding protein
MRTVFADTFFFLAVLDSREHFHSQSLHFLRDRQLKLVTTEWVLAEFGNAYSDPRDRSDFVALYRALVNNPRVRIVPADSELFQRAIELFSDRPDKAWSVVDCASFVAMKDAGINEALTGDRHFEQAGFSILFK